MEISTSSSRNLTKVLVGSAGLALAIAGTLWDEILLAAPIIILVNLFGLWLGYVVFCLIWATIGVFALSVWVKIGPKVKIFLGLTKEQKAKTARQKPDNWRQKLAFRVAQVSKFLGALTAAVVLGPILGWPVFRILGYKERHTYLLTISAAWIFGGIWVPFYGAGVWGLYLSKLT